MNVARLFSALVLMCVFFPGFCQQDALISQYHLNPAMMNPAYAGLYNSFMVNANSRLQWMGMEASPFSNFLTVTSSIVEKKVGGGVLLHQDRLGVTHTTQMSLMGAYRIETGSSTFAFGLQAGMVNVRHNFNDLNLSTDTDPYFPVSSQTSMKPSFGAGVALMGEKYYFGLSAPRLLDVTFDDGGMDYSTIYKRHLYGSFAFIMDITSFLKLKPSALLRHVDGAPLSYDVGASVLWNHKFWAGVYTRNFTTQGATFQLIVNETVRLGYALEIPTSRNIETRFLSHEVVIGIDLSLFSDQEAFLRYF